MPTLTSSSTITVTDSATALQATTVLTTVLPSVGYASGNGRGRIVHPTVGTFDYLVKPDEWVNIDGDVLVAPVWASTKTLRGASHSLWQGNIEDVICEERWGINQGGISMPIEQLRMLRTIWTTPVDPSAGYVQWFPNYTTDIGYNVLPVDVVVGSPGSSQVARLSGIGYQIIVLDDVVNYTNDGWVTQPVTQFLKIVSRI